MRTKTRRRRTCRRRTHKGGSFSSFFTRSRRVAPDTANGRVVTYSANASDGGGKSNFSKQYSNKKTLIPITKEQFLVAVKELSKCVQWIHARSKLVFIKMSTIDTSVLDGLLVIANKYGLLINSTTAGLEFANGASASENLQNTNDFTVVKHHIHILVEQCNAEMFSCINELINGEKNQEIRNAYIKIIPKINDDLLKCLEMFYAETSNDH